jgi:hypothetical protein
VADAAPAQQEPPAPAPAPTPRRRERFQSQQTHEQPEFLRRPVRRTRNEDETPDGNANTNAKNANTNAKEESSRE